MKRQLQTTAFLDHQHAAFAAHTDQFLNIETAVEKAVAVYNYVRDHWRYNPYKVSTNPAHYKASYLLTLNEGHCIDKSILMIAMLRRLGIPANLQLTKVQNHIAVERLIEKFGTNELAPHGYVNLFLEEQWVKASPAFNESLCEKFNVAPLEFNGREDAILQEFNKDGQSFMQYLEDYGSFNDLPLDFIFSIWKNHYPDFETLQ